MPIKIAANQWLCAGGVVSWFDAKRTCTTMPKGPLPNGFRQLHMGMKQAPPGSPTKGGQAQSQAEDGGLQ